MVLAPASVRPYLASMGGLLWPLPVHGYLRRLVRMTLRLLHTADTHIGRTAYGITGLPALEAFADEAIARKVHLAIIAGDVFHTRDPKPSDILAVIRACRRMADADITVVLGRGNHDGPGIIDRWEDSTAAWVRAADMTRVIALPEMGSTTFTYAATPGFWGAEPPVPTFTIHSLPYVHRRTATNEQLRALIDGFELRPGLNIFLGHLSVAGSLLAAETRMQIGWDLTVAADAFDRFDYAALGHIHRQQAVAPNAWYPGSPTYFQRDDEGPKGFLFVELDPTRSLLVVEVIPWGANPFLTVHAERLEATDVMGKVVHLNFPESASMDDVRMTVDRARRKGALSASYTLPARSEPRARAVLDIGAGRREGLAAYIATNPLPDGLTVEDVTEVADELWNGPAATVNLSHR